jgi:hypothetical protein
MASPIDYVNWMVFGAPVAAISFVLLWYYMQFYFLGVKLVLTEWL